MEDGKEKWTEAYPVLLDICLTTYRNKKVELLF